MYALIIIDFTRTVIYHNVWQFVFVISEHVCLLDHEIDLLERQLKARYVMYRP